MSSDSNICRAGICLNDPFFIEGIYYVDTYAINNKHMKLTFRMVVRCFSEGPIINKIKKTMEMEEKYQDAIIKLMCDINHCNLIVNDRVKSDSEKVELLKTYIKSSLEFGIDYLPEEEE